MFHFAHALFNVCRLEADANAGQPYNEFEDTGMPVEEKFPQENPRVVPTAFFHYFSTKFVTSKTQNCVKTFNFSSLEIQKFRFRLISTSGSRWILNRMAFSSSYVFTISQVASLVHYLNFTTSLVEKIYLFYGFIFL